MRLPSRLERAWRSLERAGESRRIAPCLFVAALVVYGLVSIALPLGEGRDLARYLLSYAQLFDEHIVYPQAVLMRVPVTPVVAGAMLDAGSIAAEVVAGVLYALSVLAWWSVARRVGPAAGLVTAVALLAYPGYVLLFHRLSSDLLFAAGFALFALLVARAVEQPNAARAAALGAGLAGLVLIRPVAQVLLLLVLVPAVAAPAWRGRVLGASAFLAAALVPLLAWAGHNQVRLDDFAVVRGSGHSLPLFRAFVADRIVEPENGPASRELARAVERDLLGNEPYRSYGIDLERFFSSGSFRMHEDLVALSDQTWGWDDDYRHLGRVGREAVLAHPWAYTRGVAEDLWDLVVWSLYVDAGTSDDDGGVTASGGPAPRPVDPTLPTPTEGEPIPSSRMAAYLSTPEQRIHEEWTSATDHHIVFEVPEDGPRGGQVNERVIDLVGSLPDRAARPELVDWLNRASRWYPRPVVWLALGLLTLLVRRPRMVATPLVVAAAAGLILLGTALAVYAVADYAVPVAPAFLLLAAAGVFGRKPRRPRATDSTLYA